MVGVAYTLQTGACGSEDPDPDPFPLPALPSAAPEALAEVVPPLIDRLGRLREGTVMASGFILPEMALEETPENAPSRTFRVRSLGRALLEFYMHRDYHVVKHRRGHLVKHSTTTLERSPNEAFNNATLYLTERGQRHQHLRITSGEAKKVHIPEVNREVLKEIGAELPEESKKHLEAVLEKTEPAAKRKSPRIIVPFNPSVPRSLGVQKVTPRVKTWLKANPGEVFYD